MSEELAEGLEFDEEGDDAEDARAEIVSRRIAELEAGRASVVVAKAAIARARERLAQSWRG